MSFFFCLTNPGLEASLKLEMSKRFPDWKLSFSAPGFITFKGEGQFPDRPYLARYWGEVLGKGVLEGGEVLRLEKGGEWTVKIHTPRPFWFDAPEAVLPEESPSRAWLKIEEAIRLFDLSIMSGDVAMEVGASPGGAVMNLLDRGLIVKGVDPALMDPGVLKHPNFTHLKKPFQELTPEETSGVDWWLSDLNLAPGSVLSHLGRILRSVDTKPRGLILTLKLAKPEVAAEIYQHEARVQEWGYRTCVRLLPSHHKEVLLLAIK
jgi:hypothetical protein